MTRKLKIQIGSAAVAALLFCLFAGCATEAQTEAQLRAQAKLTRAEAEKIALAKVQGGSIKEGELEKEHGRIIYSFDIARPGSTDITEVQVDARNGEIVSVENESAEKEAKEKQ